MNDWKRKGNNRKKYIYKYKKRMVKPEGITLEPLLKPFSFLGSVWRGMKYPATLRQAGNGAAAVIAIRLLCIKHTFVESEERREEEMEKGSRLNSSQRSHRIISLPLLLPLPPPFLLPP